MTRPTTSAGGRPQTSSGRPGTSRLDTADFFDRDPQYTYSIDETEEYEEESDAEDVFAFARPQTGSTSHHPSTQPSTQPSSVIYPPQAFNPHPSRHQSVVDNNSAAGPSGLHARHGYPYPNSPTVDTPPSTDSQAGDDPYRLKRITYTPTINTADSRKSGISSGREVHVSLPTTREEPLDEEISVKHRPPSSATSYPSFDSRDGSIKMGFDFDALDEIEEDSPYPEVCAAVSSIDDPEMPVLTFRMWLIGLFLTLTAAAANIFFTLRQPAPTIVASVLLIVAYPLGKFLAFSLPISSYTIPRWMTFGNGPVRFSLNPGPWNIKEHALVFMMMNVGTTFPYGLLAISVAQTKYGEEDFRFFFSLVMVLGTQLTGFGLAGLLRKILVWPASMLWPQNLVLCTVLNTFHAEEDADRGGLTRYKYFLYVLCGAFFWFFIPGYLFTALSLFNWVCWIAPTNKVVNQVFGTVNGLGVSFLTFDWTQITWTSNPLVMPWWAQVHTFVGFVMFYWILAPALYYTNVWNLGYFPMLANSPYDRHGKPYNVTRVLKDDSTFDSEAFDNYSPLYLPASYAITYLVAFALSSCVIVHTLLYHGKAVWKGTGLKGITQRWMNKVLKRKSRQNEKEDEEDLWEKDDIHAKLMRAYPEVPNWWYATVFFVFLALCAVGIEVWHTGLPIWGLLLGMGIVGLYVIPMGFIYAMTNEILSVNLLTQIIPGVALPGKPVANMIFKAFVIQTLSETVSFTQDLKLGHYIKVPPRATFIVQITATLLAGFVQVGVKEAMFRYIPDICTPQQRSFLTCPVNQTFYTASAVWGLIGPSRQFGKDSVYHNQLFALIVGALLPIPFWYWHRKYPNGWNKYISMPVLLNSVTFIPPATGINFSSPFLVGFIFQYLIRRKNFAWWSKFNYVTSAAVDTGTLMCLLFIFFAFEIPKGGLSVNWWGNRVWRQTADFVNEGLLPIPTDGIPGLH